MDFIIMHIRAIGSWLGIVVGLYTLYIGIQIQRRKNSPSTLKLKPMELSFALVLLVIGCFLVGVHAVKM